MDDVVQVLCNFHAKHNEEEFSTVKNIVEIIKKRNEIDFTDETPEDVQEDNNALNNFHYTFTKFFIRELSIQMSPIKENQEAIPAFF